MKTLFLAWQDTHRSTNGAAGGSRQWFPVGMLQTTDDMLYRFQYTVGAESAKREAGFASLDSFPDLRKIYESPELFPLFKNRVPSPKREDFPAFVHRLGLTGQATDPFEILAVSGGSRQTDNLEVFPKIVKMQDGAFSCRFFLHGWRHTNAEARERVSQLRNGEQLRVAVEFNNPASGTAIQLMTLDYSMVGWAPRYLIPDFIQALSESPHLVNAKVIKVNAPPAPHNQRVLVELVGKLREGREPMSAPDFQPLIQT